MIVCGASGVVFDIITTCPGSFHDSKVFQRSKTFELLSNAETRPYKGLYMLGDQAYRVISLHFPLFFYDYHIQCHLKILFQNNLGLQQ